MVWKEEMLYRHCFLTLLWNTPLGTFKKRQEGLKLDEIHKFLVHADELI